MAGGVDVNIGADTREFGRSVKSGMQDPVEDAQKALDDYVKAADSGGDDLTSTFRKQQQQTVELKGDIEKLNTTIREGSRPAYRAAATEADTFTRKSTEGFDEIRESARSNAIEVGASFTGGFDQAAGGLQGFVAEFLAGFGPAGIIAGVGAAALIGVITNAITQGQEAAEAQTQAIADLGQQYIEAGGKGRRAFDDVAQSIRDMATSDGSDVVITLQQAWEKAHVAGADYQSLIEGLSSGSVPAIEEARRNLAQLTVEHQEAQLAARSYGGEAASAALKSARAAGELDSKLAEAEKTAKAAGRAQELAAKAGLSDLQLKSDLVSQVEGAYDDAAGSADDFIGKESGVFNVTKFLKSMRERTKSLEEYHDAMATTTLDPAAIKYLESQGADTAAAMLRGYQKATPKQQAELEKVWTTAGTTSAGSYEDAIGTKLKGTTFDAPKIERPVILAPNTAQLDAFLRQPRTYRMVVEGVTRNGTRVF